jgi:hypothetical protein
MADRLHTISAARSCNCHWGYAVAEARRNLETRAQRARLTRALRRVLLVESEHLYQQLCPACD